MLLAGSLRRLPGVGLARLPAAACFSSKQDTLSTVIQDAVAEMKAAGTYKKERVITSAQDALITVEGRRDPVLNFCANNYLGLANHPKCVDAAKRAADTHGAGLASVRFICGTQDIHKQLEEAVTKFHRTEDTILYPSCFDANAGLFEALLNDQDAIISDALNHASIIDGVRLCKAQRHRYQHMDMQDLEHILQETQSCRMRLVATDGVFSMDGDIAPLDKIVELCEKYNANLFVDECHATGFMGATGRGTPEYFGVESHIDVINSTLGKALGGATGGYTTGRADVVQLLRQKGRPYLFSNSLAPPVVGAALATFSIIQEDHSLRDRLEKNTALFRGKMKEAGFKMAGHPECAIAPVMLGDARLAAEMADDLLERGIYVIGFSYPVVPKGMARIRVQISAAHSTEQVLQAVDAFVEVGRARGIIQ